MSHKFRGRKADKNGKACILLIVFAMALVMSVQIVHLYQKNQQYAAQEAGLIKQKKDEQNRQKELEEFEAYTQTQEYIEDVAKSKLGLIYEGEIIFKERRNK